MRSPQADLQGLSLGMISTIPGGALHLTFYVTKGGEQVDVDS